MKYSKAVTINTNNETFDANESAPDMKKLICNYHEVVYQSKLRVYLKDGGVYLNLPALNLKLDGVYLKLPALNLKLDGVYLMLPVYN